MSTMKEMVQEYREAAAKLSVRIQEKASAGAGKKELANLNAALHNIREVQRLLDGYYDCPRAEGISTAGWKARGYSPDDH